jgi:acyl-CoA thioester hydrolase
MIHHSSIEVRWDDLDAFGHVNNATYLTFAQEARNDFIWYSRKAAGKRELLGDMVVARTEVDYLEPIYDGGIEIDVAITVGRLGNASFELNYVISHQGKICARVKTVQVGVSMETKKSRPLNEEERNFLSDYLEVSTEG